MTDVTSETLYRKLNDINDIKRRLKDTLFNIGGYEYFENDPLFEEYPDILNQIHSRIGNLCNILDLSIYGKSVENVLSKVDVTYKNIMPYMDELQICRANLISNLNTKGVTADTNETLRSLVNKVLDIEGSGGGGGETYEDFSEVLDSISIEDNLRLDIIYFGSSDKYYELGFKFRIINVSSEVYYPSDIKIFYLTTTENGNTFILDYRDYISPHNYRESWYSYNIDIDNPTEWQLENLERMKTIANDIKNGDYSLTWNSYSIDLLVERTTEFFDKGTITTNILKLNDYEYLFFNSVELDNTYGPGGVSPLDKYGEFVMWSPDNTRRYQIMYIDGGPNTYWYTGSAGYNMKYCYDDQMVRDFAEYETNRIEVIEN